MNTDCIMTCEAVGFKTKNFMTFKNFSMSFPGGGYIAIYGSSGIGTTSLLKMMAGLLPVTVGSITYKDSHVTSIFLGSEFDLKDSNTVSDNIARWAKNDPAIIPVVTDYFGLEDIADEKCKNLSHGERKRVVLAKLLILRPKVWLLDRPYEQLDTQGADMLLSAIAGRVNNGGLVICAAGVDRQLDYYDKAQKICLDDFRD